MVHSRTHILAIHPDMVEAYMRLLDDPVAATPEGIGGGAAPHLGGNGVIPVQGALVPKLGMSIPGLATGYDYIQERVREAIYDPDVATIELDIDSPGGTIAGLYDTIDLLKASPKPITAKITNMGASAAYALAATAEQISTSPHASVGSIGVIMVHASAEKAYEDAGVKITTFKSGEYKDLGSPYRDLTEKEAELLQAKVDAEGQRFAEHVANARGLDAKVVAGFEARIFSGSEAAKLGLVDNLLLPEPQKTMEEDMDTKDVESVDMSKVASEARAEAIAAERSRVAAIMGHEKAASYPETVAALIEEGVDGAVAAKILGSLPDVEEEVVEETVVISPSAAAFDKIMKETNPGVGEAKDTGEAEKGDDSDEAVLILAAYHEVMGSVE